MWKGIIGRGFDAEAFDVYCQSLEWPSWRPQFVVLHNTAVPTLAQRPQGFTWQHIQNLERYYRDHQKWRAGPHLFIDDRKIWVFTPPVVSGTHSPSWNRLSIGVEMLGDYEAEPFQTGRGRLVQMNTVAALASLHAALGLDPQSLRLHREDPRTTHLCPGRHVNKAAIIRQVQDLVAVRAWGDHDPERMKVLPPEALPHALPERKPRGQ